MNDDDLTIRTDFKPYPELVDDRPGVYSIVDSREIDDIPTSGMIDKLRQILWAPWDAGGRLTALHELSHARWSPPRLPRTRVTPPALVLAIEDARVNMGLEHCGQRLELDGEQRGHVLALGRGDLERGDVGMYVVRAVASLGTNAAPELLGLVPHDAGLPLSALPDLVRQTQARLARARCRRGDAVCSIRQMLRIGRWLTRQLARLGIRRRDMPEPISVGCCGGGPHGPGRGGPDAHSHPGGRERPGRLLISRPPLPYPCSPAQLGRQRRRRSATEGVELRYVHRFASDQRVFAIPRPRPRGGGTVLVDVSGSMRLDADDIARIVEDAPGSTLVAIYSGRKTSGELRIVVNDGRRAGAHQLRPYGRGNIVDQPALEWLARQRAPRVWISDGRVTGRNDRSSAAIGRACDRICRSASIQRVEDAAGRNTPSHARRSARPEHHQHLCHNARPATTTSRAPRPEE